MRSKACACASALGAVEGALALRCGMGGGHTALASPATPTADFLAVPLPLLDGLFKGACCSCPGACCTLLGDGVAGRVVGAGGATGELRLAGTGLVLLRRRLGPLGESVAGGWMGMLTCLRLRMPPKASRWGEAEAAMHSRQRPPAT